MPTASAGYFIRLDADTDLPLYQRKNQMPATKIGRWTEKHKEIQRKRAATRRARVAKMTTLSSSDYKKFCDICFEFYIRWRDRWTDGLDNKRYPIGDYEHYHACHYVSRASLATRYDERNCHGQSSGHNWAMSPKAPTLIRKRTEAQYKSFMVRTYGQDVVDELESRSGQICRWTIPDWMDKATELYKKAQNINADALNDRLGRVYTTTKERRVLELIFEQINPKEA